VASRLECGWVHLSEPQDGEVGELGVAPGPCLPLLAALHERQEDCGREHEGEPRHEGHPARRAGLAGLEGRGDWGSCWH